MRYLRRAGRSAPVAEEPKPEDPDLITITFADGTKIEIPRRVLRASRNVTVQRSLTEIVAPVAREGIDVVRFTREDTTIAEISKADVPAFQFAGGPAPREVLTTGERETFMTIHTAGFQTNRGRFFDGASPVWAAIRDAQFIDELDSGARRVGKLDVLRCRVREELWRDQAGLHREVEVLQVLDVRPYEPSSQPSLFTESGPDATADG